MGEFPPDAGKPSADLLSRIYEDLRAIARARMRAERPGHTLQATALVHEAWLRILRDDPRPADRTRFLRAAAEAMRRILVEHARARGCVKRGTAERRVRLEGVDVSSEQDLDEILAVDEALRRLEQVDAQAAEVVRLRHYAGLSMEETAEALGLSLRTAHRDWAYARAWLQRALRAEEPARPELEHEHE